MGTSRQDIHEKISEIRIRAVFQASSQPKADPIWPEHYVISLQPGKGFRFRRGPDWPPVVWNLGNARALYQVKRFGRDSVIAAA
jgi:hypothetical protein